MPRIDHHDLFLQDLYLLPLFTFTLFDIGEYHIDDDTMGLVEDDSQFEDIRPDIVRHPQFHPGAPTGQGIQEDLFDRGLVDVIGMGDLHGEGRALQIDVHLTILLQNREGGLAGEVQDHPRVIGGRPVPDVEDIDRRRRLSADREDREQYQKEKSA